MKLKELLLFAILFSVALCKYSYSDQCYRFERTKDNYDYHYQYYFNKNGLPISADEIVDQYTPDERYSLHSFYYHRILSNCTNSKTAFKCDSVIESIWYKIVNTTSGREFADRCDPIFVKKYADISKYTCSGSDPFVYIRFRIGEKKVLEIKMNGKTPLPPEHYSKSENKCVWEYEIHGLIPIVTLIIIGSVILCCLIAFIILFIIAQKHRSAKRQRLEGSLINSMEPSV